MRMMGSGADKKYLEYSHLNLSSSFGVNFEEFERNCASRRCKTKFQRANISYSFGRRPLPPPPPSMGHQHRQSIFLIPPSRTHLRKGTILFFFRHQVHFYTSSTKILMVFVHYLDCHYVYPFSKVLDNARTLFRVVVVVVAH